MLTGSELRTVSGLMETFSDFVLRTIAEPKNAKEIQELAANELLTRRLAEKHKEAN
jgi:hypothetical protein